MRSPVAVPVRTSQLLVAALALALSASAAPLCAQSDGDPDPRFGVGGSTSHTQSGEGEPTAVACAPDGTCYLCMLSVEEDFRVRRVNASGHFVDVADVAFDLAGGGEDQASGAAVDAEGRPVLVGFASDATDNLIALARLTPSPGPGLVLDSAFSQDGLATQNFNGNATGWGVAVGPSGEIVAVGPYQSGGPTSR